MTQTLSVATWNIHKGFSQFNRRMMVHDLRERLRELSADVVFLQEVQGLHLGHAERHAVIGECAFDGPRRIRQDRADATRGREQHRGGGELLRDRGDVEDRVGRDRHPAFEVGHAVALRVDHLLVGDHRDRAAGGFGGRPRLGLRV